MLQCYAALVLLSPSRIMPRPSEKKFRSAKSPDEPQDLPNLQDELEGDVMTDLSIVIPAFNEVPRLPVMLKQALTHLSTSPTFKERSIEVVIVDDGSSDGTSDFALKLARDEYPAFDIRVVTLEQNLGKGGAVRHGMMHTRGRRCLMVDADGASQFEDIDRLWEEMDRLTTKNESEAAVVVGSRAHLVKTEAVVKVCVVLSTYLARLLTMITFEQRSFLRNCAMYALHLVLRLVGVGHIHDTQCGFKLFTRSAAQHIFPYQHLTGWIFDVEILLLAKQQGMPTSEVAINWKEVPESKLNVVKDSLLMFKDLLVLRANQLLGRWSAPPRIQTGTTNGSQ